MGWAASGRNGGFCAASLTHGLGNGLSRWPGEIAKLEELGARNLDEIEAAVKRYSIDCDFERTGEIDVATEPHQLGRTPRDVRGDGASTASPTAPSCSTRTHCASTSTRRRSSAASGTATASPCSTRRSWPGA